MSGAPVLQERLKNGGVKILSFSHMIAFPPLITAFCLSELRISSVSYEYNPLCYISGVNLMLLPRSLEKLGFDFPNALSNLVLLPPGSSLADLTPNLKQLEFSHQYIPEFSRSTFLESLPSSLEKLSLPLNLGFTIDDLFHLPCKLDSLSVALWPVAPDEEAKFRNASVFKALTTLSVVMVSGVEW